MRDAPAADPAATIVVRGTPSPAGNKRAFRNQYTGRIQMVESSKQAPQWRENVRTAGAFEVACECDEPGCVKLRGDFPIDEPMVVSMVFTMPKPASAPKRRIWPSARPDVSKLARSTEDALTDAGVWKDDARIVEYVRLAKVFPNEDPDALGVPGVLVRVWRLRDVLSWAVRPVVPAEPETLFDPVQL